MDWLCPLRVLSEGRSSECGPQVGLCSIGAGRWPTVATVNTKLEAVNIIIITVATCPTGQTSQICTHTWHREEQLRTANAGCLL